MAELSQQELALLEALDVSASAQQGTTQRKLAKLAGLSLGMTNLLLKRLAKMGYLKVSTLNGRTLRYILTADGMREKFNKSYDFLARSISFYYKVKEAIVDEIQSLEKGSKITILGRNELARLARDVIESEGMKVATEDEAGATELILACDPDKHIEGKSIPIFAVRI
jgi:DNA-binding MarR family transcriptional regulator